MVLTSGQKKAFRRKVKRALRASTRFTGSATFGTGGRGETLIITSKGNVVLDAAGNVIRGSPEAIAEHNRKTKEALELKEKQVRETQLAAKAETKFKKEISKPVSRIELSEQIMSFERPEVLKRKAIGGILKETVREKIKVPEGVLMSFEKPEVLKKIKLEAEVKRPISRVELREQILKKMSFEKQGVLKQLKETEPPKQTKGSTLEVAPSRVKTISSFIGRKIKEGAGEIKQIFFDIPKRELSQVDISTVKREAVKIGETKKTGIGKFIGRLTGAGEAVAVQAPETSKIASTTFAIGTTLAVAPAVVSSFPVVFAGTEVARFAATGETTSVGTIIKSGTQAGIFVGTATAIEKGVRFVKVKRFESKTKIKKEQKGDFLLEKTKDTAPSAKQPKIPKDIGKTKQETLFDKKIDIPVSKPTKAPPRKPLIQKKLPEDIQILGKKPPELRKEITFKRTTESGRQISSVRPTEQTKFVQIGFRKDPTLARIQKIKSMFPEGDVRATAIIRAIKKKRPPLFSGGLTLGGGGLVLIPPKTIVKPITGAPKAIVGALGKPRTPSIIRPIIGSGSVISPIIGAGVGAGVGSGGRTSPIIDTRDDIISDQIQDPIQDPLPREDVGDRAKPKPKQVPGIAIITIPKQEIIQEPILKPTEELITEEKVITRGRTRTRLATISLGKTTTRQTKRIVIGKEDKIPAYNILVKNKQKGFTKANIRPLTRAQAINRGAAIVDRFTNRSFTIRKSGKKVRFSPERVNPALIRKFRFSKKNPNVFVEKSAFAIDSSDEVRGIPYKAARLRRAGLIPKKTRRRTRTRFI